MIVRIIQCTKHEGGTPWYKSYIGEEFNVVEWKDKHSRNLPEELHLQDLYAVDEPRNIMWDGNGIFKQDCVIV